MKIAIVTDSGSGLTKQQAGELGIYYLPLQIIIQDKMFLDGENITVEEIYEYPVSYTHLDVYKRQAMERYHFKIGERGLYNSKSQGIPYGWQCLNRAK